MILLELVLVGTFRPFLLLDFLARLEILLILSGVWSFFSLHYVLFRGVSVTVMIALTVMIGLFGVGRVACPIRLAGLFIGAGLQFHVT